MPKMAVRVGNKQNAVATGCNAMGFPAAASNTGSLSSLSTLEAAITYGTRQSKHWPLAHILCAAFFGHFASIKSAKIYVFFLCHVLNISSFYLNSTKILKPRKQEMAQIGHLRVHLKRKTRNERVLNNSYGPGLSAFPLIDTFGSHEWTFFEPYEKTKKNKE